MADADAPTPDGEQLTEALTEVTPEAPEPAQDLQPAQADEPQVASTVEVPATPATPLVPVSVEAPSAGEGGEWDLLVSKVQAWLASGQLQQQWQTARTPLSLLAGLIALLLVLRIYGALLAVLDSIPLLPGLLELAGLIAVIQFGLTRLVRSTDRRQVIDGLRQRWQSFRGRS
jgi:hypothetical protein